MKINPYELNEKEPSLSHKKMRGLKKIKRDLKDQLKNLNLGRVVSMSPDAFEIHDQDQVFICSLKGTLKKELKQNKDRIACGDLVYFDPEKKVIVQLKERQTILMRQNPSHKHKEQILATNIDLLLITTSLLEPKLNPYLIDLYLITAQQAGLKPVIVVNKIDLLESKKSSPEAKEEKRLLEALKDQYQKLHIPFITVSAYTLDGFVELGKIMKDKASVFSGESGVGKSSLINAIGENNLRVSAVSLKNKGTHTTTTSQLLKLKSGGWCVDTPGIQSLGFKHIQKEEVRDFFPEFSLFECKFADCQHKDEKGCGLKKALEEKLISSYRLDSYYRILDEIQSTKP